MYLGETNGLESSENCRSAGGHGNQHVRLRSAQIDRIETIGPARSQILASSRGRRPDFKALEFKTLELKTLDFKTLDRRRTALRGAKRIKIMPGLEDRASRYPAVSLRNRSLEFVRPCFDAAEHAPASLSGSYLLLAPKRKFLFAM